MPAPIIEPIQDDSFDRAIFDFSKDPRRAEQNESARQKLAAAVQFRRITAETDRLGRIMSRRGQNHR